MARKELGRATYKAYRMFGVTYLVAAGQTPNWNDKVDFEQLPFRIFPPMYGLFFISQDLQMPAVKPFVYEERILFPTSANIVRIQDADGIHDVPIAEVVPPDIGLHALAIEGGANYCVFSWIGINSMMIAKCDAVVPAVYTKVYGPATHADCERYIASHGGGAFNAMGQQIKVLKDTFRAWMDNMPVGGPKLIVIGDVVAPTGGWNVSLRPASPQGINPNILILTIEARPPTGESSQVETKIPLRYVEAPPAHPYTEVTIRSSGGEFTLGVGITH